MRFKLPSCAAALVLVGASSIPAAAQESSTSTDQRLAVATASTYYLDCAAGNDSWAGTSASTAWRTLSKVSATTFAPGDQILIKRGTSCTGTLAPKGSGTAAAPILIQTYGTGDKPLIAGAGAPDAVLLNNQQGWEIRDLDITNKGTNVANRRGVMITGQNAGKLSHLVLENLNVHDVNGDDTKDNNGSGGIYFDAAGDTTFDDVKIRGNTVWTVDREGIFINSNTTRSTGVVISNNSLSDIGGDGIVVVQTTGALVERNYISGFQLRSAGWNAGMWAYEADSSVFQFNEVTGGQTTRDGMAYDIDDGNDGTIFQYNYSHDNAGGFMLLCSSSATSTISRAIVRYNLSQNDHHRGIENCAGGVQSADVHNNTIYIGPGISQTVINENTTAFRNVKFRNNIVVKQGSGAASMSLLSGGYQLDHNILVNVSGAPAGAGITSDPLLSAPGTASAQANADGYRLCTGSPALAAGMVVSGNGGRDYFGNPVSGTPNIGAYGGAGIPCNMLPDGGFESGNLSNWDTRNASITATNPHSGNNAAALSVPSGDFATIERTVSGLTPNTTYTYRGWVRTSGVSASLGVKNFGGVQVSQSSSATNWTELEVSFTTATTGTTATVYCYLPTLGSAACDGLTLSR